jgi:hypothetical protein
MTDNVIQHLTTIHVFEDHVVVMLMHDHFTHSTDIWMVEKHGEGCFAECANFFRGVFCGLLGGSFRVGAVTMARRRRRVDSRKNFYGQLYYTLVTALMTSHMENYALSRQ